MTYLILLLLPLNLWAGLFDLTEEELNPETEEILIKKPEKYLRYESMVYDLNTDMGIKDQRVYTGSDKNRLALAGHLSSDYEHLNNLFGAEISYMRRSTRYNQMWWGLQFFQHSTYFDAITQNQTSSTSPNSEASFQRPKETKNTIMAAGLGAGYRFKLLLDFYQTEDVFEMIEVYLNGLQLNESYVGKNYQGLGLSTSYGIHKRKGTSYFYGGKFAYNIASVTRNAITTESRNERSLSLGWLSLAFEMGFFY
jgi:hypothetical protein